jgi:hypothetical protein
MGSQQATSQTLTSIVAAALVGLGILGLFGNFDGAAAQCSCPLEATTSEALAVLPSVVLAAASQTLETCVFNHQWLLQGFFQMLVSFWLLLLGIAVTIVLRAVFKGKIQVFPAPGKHVRK